VKGLFITFEGPDGAGKSTHIREVRRLLEEKGRRVLVTREPGGTPAAEEIREVLLSPRQEKIDERSELLLYLAARAQHVTQTILPALEDGIDVICDRFSDSSIAYQGFGRGIDLQFLETVNAWACRGLTPDYTFLMLLPPQDAQKRLEAERTLDRMELESMDFKQRVYEGFRYCADTRPGRVLCLDANRDKEYNCSCILSAMETWLEEIEAEKV